MKGKFTVVIVYVEIYFTVFACISVLTTVEDDGWDDLTASHFPSVIHALFKKYSLVMFCSEECG